MRRCEKCGHLNLTLETKKGKRICENCKTYLSGFVECFPSIGEGCNQTMDGNFELKPNQDILDRQ